MAGDATAADDYDRACAVALENADARAMRHSVQQVRDRLTAWDMDTDPTPAVPERVAGSHRLPVPRSGGPAR